MGKKNEPVVKKYSFSKNEMEELRKVEYGMVAFEQAVMGMQMTKRMMLQNAYQRCGIAPKAPEWFERSINYNLETGDIQVTLTPKKEEVAKK